MKTIEDAPYLPSNFSGLTDTVYMIQSNYEYTKKICFYTSSEQKIMENISNRVALFTVKPKLNKV